MYGRHGLYKITDVRKEEIGGMEIENFVLTGVRDEDSVIRVPKQNALTSNMRHISSKSELGKALAVLRSKPLKLAKSWQARIRTYNEKIDACEITAAAEVVRDLYVALTEPNGISVNSLQMGFNEKHIFDKALWLLVEETSAILDCTLEKAASYLVAETGLDLKFNPDIAPGYVNVAKRRMTSFLG